MEGKVELNVREAAWIPDMSAAKEPLLSIGGYPITIISVAYLLAALFFAIKGLTAPGQKVVWHLSILGVILESIAALFAVLAIIPRNGVVREYQIIRAVSFIITHPLDVLPEPKNDNKNKKKKKTKKSKKKQKDKAEKRKKKKKKEVNAIKLPWDKEGGDEGGK